MNGVWDITVNSMLDGSLDLLHDPLMLNCWDDISLNESQRYLADLGNPPIPGVTPQALANRSVSNRALYADTVHFPSVPEGAVVRNLVLYRPADGLLIGHIDTRPDRMALAIAGNGGPVDIIWRGAVIAL